MDVKRSMDESLVSMLATENQSIYMAERAKGDYFSQDNDPNTAGKGITKEPPLAVIATGTYPLAYLMTFLKLGKANKATHVKIEMGRQDRPLRVEFKSGDSLNLENGQPKEEKTWLYCAPRIDNDYEDPPKEKILEYIAFHENEIVILKNKLPKEETKAL
jgi:hypothetical protein